MVSHSLSFSIKRTLTHFSIFRVGVPPSLRGPIRDAAMRAAKAVEKLKWFKDIYL